MSEVRFSIITCFFNSEHRLDSYFAGLRALATAGRAVEFIFVDNGSRDGTAARLAAEAAKFAAPARVLGEPKPGLMFARCTGVIAARGEFVLFLDDDNEPAPEYLAELDRLIAKYPSAIMFTGNTVLPPDYPVNRGNAGALPLLVVRDLPGEFAFRLNSFHSPYFPWGAGFFARRADLMVACREWLGDGTKAITGRSAGKLSGGEDIWLAHHLTCEKDEVVFSERLRIVHRLDPDRLRANYLGRLAFENGVEYLILTEAVARLKPFLSVPGSGVPGILRVVLLRLPWLTFQCCWRRDVTSFSRAASALGHAYALLLRLTANPRK